ncbi:MAG: rhodanese-like domain-containing protein [Candidatus Eisenbacteria bacterium]|nr:rhodanese-like domain-containing protein [Candidatus Eisenbacteria bacterium]
MLIAINIAIFASAIGIVFNVISPSGIEIKVKPAVKITATSYIPVETPSAPGLTKTVPSEAESIKAAPPKIAVPKAASPGTAKERTVNEDAGSQPEKTVAAPAAGTPGESPGAVRAPETKVRTQPEAIKENIDIRKTKELFDAGNAIFLDARPEFEYLEGHIKGALSLSDSRFDYQYGLIRNKIRKDDTLVVYCRDAECDLSDLVADRLNKLGYTRIYVLKDGWYGWADAGYPVEGGRIR